MVHGHKVKCWLAGKREARKNVVFLVSSYRTFPDSDFIIFLTFSAFKIYIEIHVEPLSLVLTWS